MSKIIKGEELTIFDMPPRNSINDYNIDEIKQIVAAGKAPEFWKVGDIIGPVNLNGQFTQLYAGKSAYNKTYDLSNYTVYFYIIGFDHNKEIESPNYHTMTLQLASKYNNSFRPSVMDLGFAMFEGNTLGDTYKNKGWSTSHMRTRHCVDFLNCLPEDWQNAIVPVTKYSDNVAQVGALQPTDVTTTEDKIFLLSIYEISGTAEYGTTYESSDGKQKQYDWYASHANRLDKYLMNSVSKSSWWSRSTVHVNNSYDGYYGYVNIGSGSSQLDYISGRYDNGFAPAFNIGIAS